MKTKKTIILENVENLLKISAELFEIHPNYSNVALNLSDKLLALIEKPEEIKISDDDALKIKSLVEKIRDGNDK